MSIRLRLRGPGGSFTVAPDTGARFAIPQFSVTDVAGARLVLERLRQAVPVTIVSKIKQIRMQLAPVIDRLVV